MSIEVGDMLGPDEVAELRTNPNPSKFDLYQFFQWLASQNINKEDLSNGCGLVYEVYGDAIVSLLVVERRQSRSYTRRGVWEDEEDWCVMQFFIPRVRVARGW